MLAAPPNGSQRAAIDPPDMDLGTLSLVSMAHEAQVAIIPRLAAWRPADSAKAIRESAACQPWRIFNQHNNSQSVPHYGTGFPIKKSIPMDEQTLTTLVRAAQAGDREAFGELARQFEPTVFAIALKRLRNRSEAYELTQDVFIQAMRKIDQLRDPRRFAGWVRQIAVRLAINRAVRRPSEALAGPESFAGLAARPDSPLETLLAGERASQLRGGLDKLKDLDRRTLVAFYFEGRSLREMSDEFDSPVGTIKRRLHTARNRLKEQLGELIPA